MIKLTTIETPMGEMLAGATMKGICLLEFKDTINIEKIKLHFGKFNHPELIHGTSKYFKLLEEQLTLYFNKAITQFDIPLDIIGTDFQRNVWSELLNIPFGNVRTYKAQTLAIGDIKAIRAVANANGKNKIAILIPCHRVIGTNGKLTGYAGGLWRKQFLLNLESSQENLFSGIN